MTRDLQVQLAARFFGAGACLGALLGAMVGLFLTAGGPYWQGGLFLGILGGLCIGAIVQILNLAVVIGAGGRRHAVAGLTAAEMVAVVLVLTGGAHAGAGTWAASAICGLVAGAVAEAVAPWALEPARAAASSSIISRSLERSAPTVRETHRT